MSICVFTSDVFGIDTIELAQKISRSLSGVDNPKYSTLAFSRIQGSLDRDTINEIIDFSQNELVGSGRFRVIDRSKLQLILNEQKFNLSGMVSKDTYKELGQLLGVDLFVYGRYYDDVITFKAIDVESSAIVWADIFQLTELTEVSSFIVDITNQISDSLETGSKRLTKNKIRQISFWNITSEFDSSRLIDFLSTAITKNGSFQVVDRDNLQLILEEQKLSMSDFIDEQKAKKMGELYGVDAFVYGRITPRGAGYIGSFKMLNIYSGVIEWAKTLRFEQKKKSSTQSIQKNQNQTSEMVFIESGIFTMGSNEGDAIYSPEFKVPLKAFYIDKTEVSNRAYARFVRKFKHRAPPSWPGGKIPKGKDDFPVVQISWNDANRYCVSQRKRLPKEVEWEKAFRGTEGRRYPWLGNQFSSDFARTVESGVLGPEKVLGKNRDVSVYGVIHLAGNVREWVSSYLKPYPGSSYPLSRKRLKVIRGGSWAKNKNHSVGWYREGSNPNYGWEDVGFRCAKSAP